MVFLSLLVRYLFASNKITYSRSPQPESTAPGLAECRMAMRWSETGRHGKLSGGDALLHRRYGCSIWLFPTNGLWQRGVELCCWGRELWVANWLYSVCSQPAAASTSTTTLKIRWIETRVESDLRRPNQIEWISPTYSCQSRGWVWVVWNAWENVRRAAGGMIMTTSLTWQCQRQAQARRAKQRGDDKTSPTGGAGRIGFSRLRQEE